MAHILLVDDDVFLRTLMGHMLTAHGHTLSEADGGIEGLEHIKVRMPDIIITDIIMDKKEGLDFIRDVRGQSYDVPIIAISAGSLYGKVDYLRMAQSLGANDSLQKPVKTEILLEKIDRLLLHAN